MLTVVSNPPGAGTYEVSPVKSKYAAVDYVTLTAVPSAGYVFGHWSGHTEGIDDPSQNPVTFRMGDRTDNNRMITANFVASDRRCALTVTVEPDSGGSVSLQPAQPADGYPINQSVRVYAVAQPGYVFSRWSGALAGNENPRTLRLSEDRSIKAIFNPTITTYCSPPEGGSITLTPDQPSGGYVAGTEVTVSAIPTRGYRFVGWEGDLSGPERSVTFTVDEAKMIAASFEKRAESRWWLWVILGIVGLLAVFVVVRVLSARMNRPVWDEPQPPDG